MGLGACGRALIVLAIASGAAVQQPELTLRDWLDAIDTHRPGEIDRALELIAATPPERLADLQGDLWQHITTHLPQGRGIQIGRRAAMLHFDVAATLHLRAGDQPRFQPITRTPRGALPPGGTIVVNDGIVQGYERAGYHWRFGRAVLGAISPKPADDDFTQLWFRAAAAVMSNLTMYSDLRPHLERAQALWPRQAWVQMDRGGLAECFGSPRIQVVVRSTQLPPSTNVAIGSERSELERAENYFRAALALDPSFTAARLRLGRVLSLTGRPQEALGHLAHATEADKGTETRYLAHLFTGRAHEALGRIDEARQSYAAAASLFPRAQAPILSISQLANRPGVRPQALKALEKLLMRSHAVDEQADPWWTYNLWHHDDSERIVAELHAAVPPGGGR